MLYAGGKFNESIKEGGDGYAVVWGLEYEHQWHASPLSLFARYEGQYMDTDDDDDDDHTVAIHSVLVGLRARFGYETLQDQGRNGAGTFDLPDVGFLAGTSNNL